MNTRRYCIFTHNGSQLWGLNESFLGPDKIELVGEAFLDFWIEFFGGRRNGYIMFACPTIFGEGIYPMDNIVIPFWTNGDRVLEIDKERIAGYLYPELENVMEYILRIELKRNYKR